MRCCIFFYYTVSAVNKIPSCVVAAGFSETKICGIAVFCPTLVRTKFSSNIFVDLSLFIKSTNRMFNHS